jgi:hypothetical protein
MAQYIDKDALKAEIERLHKAHSGRYGCDEVGLNLEYLEDFIDTLEVKEVDLESEQRMRECPYRQVVCTMYEGKMLECKGACSWVVDYPKLKELKTQKGE